MHRLADPADRQSVHRGDRVRRFMYDRSHKVIDRIDTKTAGNAVAVVDEIAVGRERLVRGGNFQSPML